MNNLPKPTPSQLALWHGVTALVLSTATSSGMAIFQYVSSHPVNVGQDVSYGLMMLIMAAAVLPVSIYHLIKSSPALPQAIVDTEAQAKQVGQAAGEHVLSQVGPWFEAHFKNVGTKLQSLESLLANHAHVPVPSVPQLPFQVTNMTASTPSSSVSMTPQPVATGGVVQPSKVVLVNDSSSVATTPTLLETFPVLPSVKPSN